MIFLLGLNMILWLSGFLLPVPCFIFAWREWLRIKRDPPASAGRRKMAQFALYLFALGLVFWIYAILREWSGHYVLYDGLTAKLGRFASLGLVIIFAFAESKVRRYLLLGAVGLLLYFAVSVGELAI
jgi:hypothetical protein